MCVVTKDHSDQEWNELFAEHAELLARHQREFASKVFTPTLMLGREGHPMTTFDLRAELAAGQYTPAQISELAAHTAVIEEAMKQRNVVEGMGGSVAGYIRSAITESPSQQLNADLDAGLKKLAERFPRQRS